MPLQEADLKSYDAYKKAMRADASKITNTSQTKFWVYKDIEMLDLRGTNQNSGLSTAGGRL